MADERPYPVTPVEAFAHAISCAIFPSDSKRRWPKPGAVIERAPRHIREALQALTSDEAAKVRFEPLAVDTPSPLATIWARLAR